MKASTLWSRVQRPLVLLAMQSCWLYTWLAVVEHAAIGQRAIAGTTVLLLVIAAAWRQATTRLGLRRLPAGVLYWVALPIVAALAARVLLFPHAPVTDPDWLLAIPRAFGYLLYETRTAELLIALGSAAAWYLNSQLSGAGVTYERLLGQFQLGIFMLLTSLLIGYGFDSPVPRAGLLILCFFAVALAGIASARSTDGRTRGPGHVTTSVVTLVVVVSGIGILIGAIATPGLIDSLIGAVEYVMHLLGEAIAYIASLFPEPEFTPTEPGESLSNDDSALREFYKSIPVPAILRRALFIVWLTVVLGTLLVALWRIFSALLERLRRRQSSSGEERESLENGFLADLLALLAAVQAGIGMLVQRIRSAVSKRLNPQKTGTARSAYLAFLAWAERKLAPREVWQSPHEYLDMLAGIIPDAAPELAYITESYVQVRYGGHELTPESIENMIHAFTQIRKTRKSGRVSKPKDSQEGLQS